MSEEIRAQAQGNASVDYSLSRLAGAGDHPAVLAFGPDDVRRWTYAELDRVAGQLANGFAEAGLGEGSVVAMLALPSPEYIAVTLAVLRVGATIAPIDAQFADDSLIHIIDDAKPKWLFTDERGARRIDKLKTDTQPNVMRLDTEDGDASWQTLLADEAREAEAGAVDQRAVLFYTSGTTGAPKGVPLTRANIVYQFNVARDTGLIKPEDRLLLPLPLHHVYPFVIGLLAPLHIGMAILIPAALTGPQLARAIREGEASIVLGVPRLHRALIDGIRNKAEGGGLVTRVFFRSALRISLTAQRVFGWSIGRILFGSLHRKMGGKLRIMASGGSPLDARIAAQIEALGWGLAVGYGLTETSPLLTILRPGDRKLDTVGQIVPGTELKIDLAAAPGSEDSEDAEVVRKANVKAGEVLAKGPGVFRGYHNLDDATKAAFTDGWYRTGDLGWIDDDGFLHLEGRVSTMLVLEGGENISPDKLEEIYENVGEEIAEIGILQRAGKLVAVIVPQQGIAGDEAKEKIKSALQSVRQRIPSYQRLTDFKVSTRDLPRTRLGKIRRHKLEELYDADQEERQGETGPIAVEDMSSDDQSLLDNDKAHALWELLSKRYRDHRLQPESRLEADLAIDSMEWVELSTAIEAETGLQFGDEVMENAETVHDLLEAAVGPSGKAGSDSRKAIRDPDSVLDEEDKRWIQPRTSYHKVVAYVLYLLHEAFMRTLFRVELRGRENLPDHAPYVLAPNHTSYMDPSALISGIRRPLIETFYWAGLTKAMFSNALMRGLSRISQVFPIDPRRGPMASLVLGAAALKRGDAMVWFPEGRRSPEGKLLPFRPGLGLILKEYPDVPIVPVFIDGTFEALPVGKALPRPRRITVYIGKPVLAAELEKRGEGDTPHQRIVNALHDAVAALKSADSP